MASDLGDGNGNGWIFGRLNWTIERIGWNWRGKFIWIEIFEKRNGFSCFRRNGLNISIQQNSIDKKMETETGWNLVKITKFGSKTWRENLQWRGKNVQIKVGRNRWEMRRWRPPAVAADVAFPQAATGRRRRRRCRRRPDLSANSTPNSESYSHRWIQSIVNRINCWF